MTDRRYSEEEMRAIFERATAVQQGAEPGSAPAPAGGMTLVELQQIGREVGIPEDLVARAARSLERRPDPPVFRHLAGLPVGVSRTVELGRRLSDEEWEQLVSELRVTFDARGRVREEGSTRHWSNGNLQVYLEPSGAGQRLRLRTVKGNAVTLLRLGGGLLLGSAAMTGLYLFSGLANHAQGAFAMAAVGVGALVAAVWQLPGWARRRASQMDHIAEIAAGPDAEP